MKKSPLIILIKVFLIEILREKWFYGALCVAGALLLLNLSLGSLTFDEQERIVFHLSLSSIQILGLGICLIFGVSTMSKEVEKQTCLLILARPVSRTQFLVAKGLALSVFLGIFDFSLGTFLGILMHGNFPWDNLYSIILTTWLEHIVILSLALCAGLFLGKAVAGLFTLGTFILGHWLPDLEYFAKKSNNAAFELFSKIVNYTVPHLYEMDQRSIYFLKSGLAERQLLWIFLHAIGWCLLIYTVAAYLWRRKDLV